MITLPELNQAPLPFIGQKRNFIPDFKAILAENIPNEGEGWIIVDVFGGSGLLAHVAKRTLPKARVIYNDFDRFSPYLTPESVERIEALRRRCLALVAGIPYKHSIPDCIKATLVQELHGVKNTVPLSLVSSWFLFSGQQEASWDKLLKSRFYNGIRKSPLPNVQSYLEGLEVVHACFTQLLPQFIHQENTLLLFDPPYLCTLQQTYQNARYFDLVLFLTLMDALRPPYLFFSSDKSEFLRYKAYITETKGRNWQALHGATLITKKAVINRRASYHDYLMYKF